MQVTSYTFGGFLLLALLIYHYLPQRGQHYWLLFLSYFFIFTWDPTFALTLAVLTVGNFVIAQELQQQFAYPRLQRLLLALGITFNLVFWLIFKYFDFFYPGFEAIAGLWGQSVLFKLVIPIGLSYRILENISYLLDIRQKLTSASTDLVTFGLYVVYFPKLIAGPIERAVQFLPIFSSPISHAPLFYQQGVALIVLGLFQKIVIANFLKVTIPDELFTTPSQFNRPQILWILVANSFYLYNDFAGYSNLVRGISRMFGIELSPNFDTPYFARSFTEFWNRWHISFSSWLRDYLFLPLNRALLRTKSRYVKVYTTVFPPLFTMLMSGLWHSISLPLMVWGLLHGLYQIGGRLPSLIRGRNRPPQTLPYWQQGLNGLAIFSLVSLAWLPFITDLPTAQKILERMVQTPAAFSFNTRIAFFIGVSLILDVAHYWQGEFAFLKLPQPAKAAIFAVACVIILFVSQSNLATPEFVYRGF